MLRYLATIGIGGLMLAGGWYGWSRLGESPTAPPDEFRKLIAALEPIHETLGPPQPGDWLLHHEEPGQTFAEYLGEDPTIPTEARGALYILPLGDFTLEQRRIVDATAEFMALYFGMPTRVQESVSLDLIPPRARRVHPSWGVSQVLSTYVLDEVLRERLPADAAAYLALTASDLWPGRGWNFVFGQASLHHRVGVWSIHRNGDPAGGEAAFRRCLLRTLKTATHETGHMLSIRHCTAYECNMCGSNHREESDRRPLALCPECTAKVCWATGAAPRERFDQLERYCRRYGLTAEADFYALSRGALTRSQ